MRTHSRFDLAYWIREIPLSKLRIPDRELYIQTVAGPRDIAAIEQLRAEGDLKARGEGIPTDVCVWSIGESDNPAATKIGGRPYRPTSAPWPTAKDGTPMGLLAQFNFTDSLDVLDPIPPKALPGDVMLVFTTGPHLYADWDPDERDSWAIEWHRVSPRAAVPPPQRILDLTPTFAALHRTMDYAESEIDDDLNIIWATKFGGIPPYQQSDPELPGSPLCTLGSLNPFGNPWPMLNVEVNPNGDEYLDPKLLMLGDLGSGYFNLDKKSRVHWSADCG